MQDHARQTPSCQGLPYAYRMSIPSRTMPPQIVAPPTILPPILPPILPREEPTVHPRVQSGQLQIDPLLNLSTEASDALGPKVLAKLPDFIKAYAEISRAVDESSPMAGEALARILLEGPLEHAIRRQVRLTSDRDDIMSEPELVGGKSLLKDKFPALLTYILR